jgi:hypothetical protein
MKLRQGSCFVKDLKKEEMPDFLKNNSLNTPKVTIKDAMFVAPEDEALQ